MKDEFARLDADKKYATAARDKEPIKLADIGKSDNKVAELATAIGKLENDFARLDAEKQDATAARDIEKSDNKVAELATAIVKLEDDFARLDAVIKDANGARGKEHAEAIKPEQKTQIHKIIADLSKLQTELSTARTETGLQIEQLKASRDTQRDTINEMQETAREANSTKFKAAISHLSDDVKAALDEIRSTQAAEQGKMEALMDHCGVSVIRTPARLTKGKGNYKGNHK